MINMNCPSCGAAGRVANDKVNTRLLCKKCYKEFHITSSGRAVIGPPTVAATALGHPEHDPHSIDHSLEVDQWFEKLNVSLHKLAKSAAKAAAYLAAVVLLYGIYRYTQPPTLDHQANEAAKALARNDLAALQKMSLAGTDKATAEWYEALRPQFKEFTHGLQAVPKFEVVNIRQDRAHGLAEITAVIRTNEPVGRMGIVVPDTSTSIAAGQVVEAPIVLSGGGWWGGWRLDGKRTLEKYQQSRASELAKSAIQ